MYLYVYLCLRLYVIKMQDKKAIVKATNNNLSLRSMTILIQENLCIQLCITITYIQ